MTLKTCLRCDWHGETEEPKCPNCGEQPLYVVGAPPSEGNRRTARSHPETPSREAASTKSVAPSGPPLPPDSAPSPSAAIEPSSRSARSAVTFVLTALALTLAMGTWLNTHRERSARSASTGTAAQETTPASEDSLTPIVSPGSFVRIVPGADRAASGPYFLDLRTGTRSPLPESIAGGHNYAASSSGTKLAYVEAGEEGSPQIFMAGIDGTRVRQKTHGPGRASSPALSPDGTMIAHTGKAGLFVLDVDTGESTQIADETHRWSQPQFTPDGSSVIYTGGSASRPKLRIVPVAGGESTLLIDMDEGLKNSGGGSISPDGSLLIFVGGGSVGSSHCGPCHLVANADGTEMRVFLPYCGWNPAGAWSPDGSRIVCSKGSGIIVVDIATGDVSRVAEGSGAIWLDRHTLLVEV